MQSTSPDASTAYLASLYRLASELLLYPDERRPEFVAEQLAGLDGAPAAIADPVTEFMAASRSSDPDEYLLVLELTPPCPLYLGSYIYNEPQSCRGAGYSGRNAYMLELGAVYRHFGFEIGHGELSDFLPAMAEFLAISLDARDRDSIGLRRRFVEKYVKPGLPPMRAALGQYDSPYGLIIQALETAVAEDIQSHVNDPIWVEPQRVGKPPAQPVVTFSASRRSVSAGEAR